MDNTSSFELRPIDLRTAGARAGFQEDVIDKLLPEIEVKSYTTAVSWMPHGTASAVCSGPKGIKVLKGDHVRGFTLSGIVEMIEEKEQEAGIENPVRLTHNVPPEFRILTANKAVTSFSEADRREQIPNSEAIEQQFDSIITKCQQVIANLEEAKTRKSFNRSELQGAIPVLEDNLHKVLRGSDDLAIPF